MKRNIKIDIENEIRERKKSIEVLFLYNFFKLYSKIFNSNLDIVFKKLYLQKVDKIYIIEITCSISKSTLREYRLLFIKAYLIIKELIK